MSADPRVIEAYLRGRPQLRRVCLLIDARHGIMGPDREIMAMLDEAAVKDLDHPVVLETEFEVPKHFTGSSDKEAGLYWPHFLPDGRRLVATRWATAGIPATPATGAYGNGVVSGTYNTTTANGATTSRRSSASR